MPLRSFSQIPYLPFLSIRPAEMLALQELPERDKDLLCPYLPLRPWTTAHHLESVLSRIEDAYGDRPFFVGLDGSGDEGDRPVHEQLEALRQPNDGYRAWFEFVESQPNFMPSLILDVPAQLSLQARRLHSLERGMLVHVPQAAFLRIPNIAQTVSAQTEGGSEVCFLLDFERQGVDLANRQIETVGYINQILAAAPNAFISISASSFPEGFGGIDTQEIYERSFFNGVDNAVATENLIYSDRGSARARSLGGGGGAIPPRIDYAQRARWDFFRAEDADGNRAEAYREQALAAMESEDWEPELRLWGTQMIERTSLGDITAITSQARATAVRINLHLHRQLFYSDPEAALQTDEEWQD